MDIDNVRARPCHSIFSYYYNILLIQQKIINAIFFCLAFRGALKALYHAGIHHARIIVAFDGTAYSAAMLENDILFIHRHAPPIHLSSPFCRDTPGAVIVMVADTRPCDAINRRSRGR
jgi:cellobiose-specific phosphotransferase system component IIC